MAQTGKATQTKSEEPGPTLLGLKREGFLEELRYDLKLKRELDI